MGAGADLVWSRLPEYVRSSDDGTLAAWLAAVAGQLDPALALLDSADPDTSVSGTSQPADPGFAARDWLGWLGWLVGIDTTGLADGDVRGAIASATSGRRRGSVPAIVAAVQRTLTGAREVTVIRHYGGDPYALAVITRTEQTPSPSASEAAALTEKPAGIDLTFATASGTTWGEITASTATWADVYAVGTWADVLDWTP